MRSEVEELAVAAARLEAELPATRMPRTRALLDRARDVQDGLPIGMSTQGLLALIAAATDQLQAEAR